MNMPIKILREIEKSQMENFLKVAELMSDTIKAER